MWFVSETLALWLGGLIACLIHQASDAEWELIARHGWLKLLLLVAFVQLSFYLFDLYDVRSLFGRGIVFRLAKAYGLAGVVLALLFYTVPWLRMGRGMFLISIGCTFAISLVLRLAADWYAGHPRLGIRERILILGSGNLAIETARATLERPGSGFSVVGFVDDRPELLGVSLINPKLIGLTGDLERVVDDYNVDRIVVAVEDRRGRFPIEGLLKLRLSGRVVVEESACYYERLTGKIATEMLRPSWLIFSRGGRSSEFEQRLRYIANVIAAGICFLACLPVMLIAAIAIKMESRGPVLYLQTRVGRDNRLFKIIKFRSMDAHAEMESGPVWASVGDPRVTRVGRVIRKLRIDELPQFINIVKGDMNFIGPRPERPEFVTQLSEKIPYYSERHLVRPGLTGWAQIRFPYGASLKDAAEKLRYDLYYIKNQSWLLDAIIVFETFKIVLFGRGAR